MGGPVFSTPEWETAGTDEPDVRDTATISPAGLYRPDRTGRAVSMPLSGGGMDPQPYNPNFQVNTGLTDWLNVMAFGATGNGVTDDTGPLQATCLIATQTGQPIYIPQGNYVFSGLLTVPYNVLVRGTGPGTVLKYAGTGTAVSMHNPATNTNANYYQFPGGSIENLVIDGTNAGAASIGLSIGDAWGLGLRRVKVQNFTGAGSIGLNPQNQVTWTEKARFQATIVNCATLVQIDGLPGNASFEYNDFDFDCLTVAGQQGVVLTDGAYMNGGDLRIIGNFDTSNTQSVVLNTAVLTLTGNNGASIYSHIAAGAHVRIRVETRNGHTYGPQTINFGATNNQMLDCYGSLTFGNAGWATSNAASGQFTFGGIVGDSALRTINAAPTGWV